MNTTKSEDCSIQAFFSGGVRDGTVMWIPKAHPEVKVPMDRNPSKIDYRKENQVLRIAIYVLIFFDPILEIAVYRFNRSTT